MSYLALARKWRPRQFSEVVGQEHVVTALSHALDSQRIHHAFLFTGTRGVGKTTLARIFARALNCTQGVSATPCGECVACRGVDQGNFVDLIEVDAASRTRVDDTRELLDNVQYTPTQGRYKIYLIDEVHMLSTHSFNALLKTLEEPPEHVKFLLATTNPQKLPATILSRCIQFSLRSLEPARIAAQLEKILTAEEVAFDTAALAILARAANRSLRDALSLLDQAIAHSGGNVSADRVREMLGMLDDRYIATLLEAIIGQDSAAAYAVVETICERAADYHFALDELLLLIHHVALYQHSPKAVESKGLDQDSMAALAAAVDAETLQLLYQIGVAGKRDFDFAPDPRSGFEMMVLRMLAFMPGGQATSRASPAAGKPPPVSRPAAKKPPPAATVPKRQPDAVAVDAITGDQVEEAAPDSRAGEAAAYATGAKAEPIPSAAAPDVAAPRLEELLHLDAWQAFIERVGLSGIEREILMNMSPRQVRQETLMVVLEHASRLLFSEKRRQQIEAVMRGVFGPGFSLEVAIEDLSSTGTASETPNRKRERVNNEAASQAVQDFTEDANVKEMMEVFDADIVPDSIKPGSDSH